MTLRRLRQLAVDVKNIGNYHKPLRNPNIQNREYAAYVRAMLTWYLLQKREGHGEGEEKEYPLFAGTNVDRQEYITELRERGELR